MPTLKKACELLAEVYVLRDIKLFATNEEFISYLKEFELSLAVASAITQDIVEATPAAENFIYSAYEELAEIFGMTSEELEEYDSIRNVLNVDIAK